MFELCDADNTARATVRVVLKVGGELFFCAHHFSECLEVVRPQAEDIQFQDTFTPQQQLLTTV